MVWADDAMELDLEGGESATDVLGESLEGTVEVGPDPVVVTTSRRTLAPRLASTGD